MPLLGSDGHILKFEPDLLAKTFRRDISSSRWYITDNKICNDGLVSDEFKYYLIDPVALNTMGKTKISTLNNTELVSLHHSCTSTNLVIDNSNNFKTSQWIAMGWDPDTFSWYPSYGDFWKNEVLWWADRHSQAKPYSGVNGPYERRNMLFARRIIDGDEYIICILYDGNDGLEISF
jgi:hypothetical protein